MVWQCDVGNRVTERLVICSFGGLCPEHVEDLIQWYAADHIIVCSCQGRDAHVNVAVSAVAACGGHASLHLAVFELYSPADLRSILEKAREYIAEALLDELGGSVLLACGTGASFSVAVALAHIVGDNGGGLEDAFRKLAAQHWCIWPSALLVSELLTLESWARAKAGRETPSTADQQAAIRLIGVHGAWAKAKHIGCECSWELAEAAWDAVHTCGLCGRRSLECTFTQCAYRIFGAYQQRVGSLRRPVKRSRCGPHPRRGVNNEVVTHVDAGLETLFTVIEFGELVNSICFPTECGHILWPGGHALATALAKDTVLPPGALEGKVVLELGAGVGLPGLVAARKGAKSVWLTDQLSVVGLTASNAAANALADTVYCTELDWSQPGASAAAGRRFDIVLATDVVYAEGMTAFSFVLPVLMEVHTTLLLAYTKRPNCRNFLEDHVLSLFRNVHSVMCNASGGTECEVFILSGFTAKRGMHA